VYERLRMLGATDSGTSAPPGRYRYRVRGFVICGRSVVRISTAVRDSSGSAWCSPACAHHSATSFCSWSGCCSARSWHSLGSASVSNSSQRCTWKSPHESGAAGTAVAAFQPSCQIARVPSIE
jgi:hypothetical protein